MQTPNLKKKIAERDGVIANLEHAINIREVTGKVPEAKNMLTRQTSGSAITALGDKLIALNKEISQTIDTLIENANNIDARSVGDDSFLGSMDESYEGPKSPLQGGVMGFAKNSAHGVTKFATNTVKDVGGIAKGVGGAGMQLVGSGANLAKGLIVKEDGALLTAGFVTFNSLRAAHAALQMMYVCIIFCLHWCKKKWRMIVSTQIT